MTSPPLPLSARAGAVVAFAALACGAVGAQPQTCPDLLAAAEQRYTEQVYIDVAPLVHDCLSLEPVPAAEAERAYRLLARAYLKQGMRAEARGAVVALLGLNPAYTADPRSDLPSYVAVVDEARGQLAAPPDAPAAAAPAAAAAPPAGSVDVNTAGADVLDTVPGIGPALAARIIAHREQNGPFRSVAGLEAVRGIGPRSIERMRPYLTAGGAVSAAPPAGEAVRGRVNVNTATEAELETLPGIGPALAGRIVEFRSSFGIFRDLSDLLMVRGIGPGKLEAIAPLATVK